ncbi:DNA mismatch repair protein MutS [Striga asiatica]|uniref:DNA mismatch repair protein MutS n=1 Tax=Striga asiatica TaxID=4170 RepID=A0A5A7R7X3_STRAF|nr:DNA mismatch repair protein MutS [Striga asiatica]
MAFNSPGLHENSVLYHQRIAGRQRDPVLVSSQIPPHRRLQPVPPLAALRSAGQNAVRHQEPQDPVHHSRRIRVFRREARGQLGGRSGRLGLLDQLKEVELDRGSQDHGKDRSRSQLHCKHASFFIIVIWKGSGRRVTGFLAVGAHSVGEIGIFVKRIINIIW